MNWIKPIEEWCASANHFITTECHETLNFAMFVFVVLVVVGGLLWFAAMLLRLVVYP